MEEARRVGACERCQRRKAKCNKDKPACMSCARAQVPCVYPTLDPPSRKQDVERLERRLRQLEVKNAALSSQLQQYRSAQEAPAPHSDSLNGQGTSNCQAHTPLVPQRQADNNSVASHVSYLSLNAGGEPQFLGSASGLLLANLLEANISQKPQRTEENLALPLEPVSLAKGSQNNFGSATADISALPPEMISRQLFSAYFAHDYLCYPILNPIAAYDALDKVYKEDNYYESHAVEAYFVDMILAIATTQVHKFNWQVLSNAETHHNRAMSRNSLVLATGGVPALQAILFLCHYRMSSSLYDSSASLWHLIGIAARMCFELGLHRESSYCVESPREIESASDEAIETKRRCFWCVLSMDRIVSLTLGRPLAIQLDDIDVELPRPEGAFDASPGEALSPPTPGPGTPQWRFTTIIFVHIVRYRVICGKILTSFHSTTRSKSHQGRDFLNIRNELARELDTWRSDTLSLPLPSMDVTSTMPVERSSFRSREWYDLLYHNGVLMLFRPSSALSDVNRKTETLQRLFDAAQRSITIYGYLHRSGKLNYSWITLHAVFIAGLSYIYASRTHFQSQRRHLASGAINSANSTGPLAHLNADLSISQVVNDTRVCSNVLVALSERRNLALNCHQLFGRLSDAVLTDMIEFQTQTAASHCPLQNQQNLMPYTQQPQHFAGQKNTSSFYLSAMDSQAAQFTQSSSPPEPSYFQHDNPASANYVPNAMGPGPPMSMMTVDNALQDCFDDLQQLCNFEPFSNDSIMQLSQDWLYEIQAQSGGVMDGNGIGTVPRANAVGSPGVGTDT